MIPRAPRQPSCREVAIQLGSGPVSRTHRAHKTLLRQVITCRSRTCSRPKRTNGRSSPCQRLAIEHRTIGPNKRPRFTDRPRTRRTRPILATSGLTRTHSHRRRCQAQFSNRAIRTHSRLLQAFGTRLSTSAPHFWHRFCPMHLSSRSHDSTWNSGLLILSSGVASLPGIRQVLCQQRHSLRHRSLRSLLDLGRASIQA